jgi:hypothetical protein
MTNVHRAVGSARLHLHIDGLALLAGSLVAYGVSGGSWGLFFALLLVPDLVMVGYLAGPRVGAIVYNAGHSLVWPVLLAAAALVVGGSNPAATFRLLHLGLIWGAHIGMDRALGFGYKYPSGFNDTDIGRA